MERSLPVHIAIIPDGNRRWARERNLPPWEGHRKGAERFKEITNAAFRRGIKYLTLWAASESNLTERSKEEVAFLVSILTKEIERMSRDDRLAAHQARIRIIGNWDTILGNDELKRAVDSLEKKTAAFNNHHLTILFGYDGKSEMIEAINKLISDKRHATSDMRQVTGDMVRAALRTGELPDVDLVIRTGGEPHWSAGFMMWQTSDSQFYFTETLWPDFDAKEFENALEDFARRERRFGK